MNYEETKTNETNEWWEEHCGVKTFKGERLELIAYGDEDKKKHDIPSGYQFINHSKRYTYENIDEDHLYRNLCTGYTEQEARDIVALWFPSAQSHEGTNKLIAEFMVSDNRADEKTHITEEMKKGYLEEITWYAVGGWTREEDLQYHTSWDWLMTAVDKIESICINSTEMAAKLDGSSYLWYWDANEIGHRYDPARHIVSTSNRNYVYVCGSVDNVYQAVVEFIKFYNNLKN